MQTFLLVGIGGMLGASARYAVVAAVAARLGPRFPWGTLLVNASGSFAIGLAVTLLLLRGLDHDHDPTHAWRLFLVTGVLGGYTTFSAYSLELITLLQHGRWSAAALYAAASTALGLAACALGIWLARAATG